MAVTDPPASLAGTPPPEKTLAHALDLAAAAALTVGLSPLLAGRALWAKLRNGRVFERTELIGRHRRPFQRLHFAGSGTGAGLAVLFNLLRGDLAWVGPRPLSAAEAEGIPPEFAARFSLRPGLVSPHAVRRNVGIAYEDEARGEWEFFFGAKPGHRLGLLARSLVARLLAGSADRPVPPILDFFGLAITNTTMQEALDWIVARVRGREPALVAFVNPDCLNIAYRQAGYRRVLQAAERVLPDGIGIKLGCRILGVGLRENVNGTDMFPLLCERAEAEGLSLFLLGARPGVAEAAAAEMRQRRPALRIVGIRHGYFETHETAAVLEEINRSGADILLVAFGAPRQELWLAEHGEQLAPVVRMGVGGLFDFYSGRIPRAPLWMREIGLEWLYRLMQEPGRMWRRYIIGNPLFLYRVWRQRLKAITP